MQKVVLVARILLGLVFFVFGINFFLQFLHQPPPPEVAGAFLGGLAASGYFFPMMKVIDILCGLLLIAGRWVPLALTVLAPIVVNIFLYHLFLDPSGLPLAGLILALEIFLAWGYRGSFKGVLAGAAKPG